MPLISPDPQSELGWIILMTGDEGALKLDFEDDIIAGACVTRDGDIVHPRAREAAGLE